MARIRTIKPEFPHSESMGNVSRDARLTFIMLWTLADDSGRLRGNSRMLASLLFPYDDDAPSKIADWLADLERVGCITLYEHEGTSYCQIRNWLAHQKIDKPSKSRFPEPREDSRKVASPRECSSGDQGPRTKDQGPRTKDQGADAAGKPDGSISERSPDPTAETSVVRRERKPKPAADVEFPSQLDRQEFRDAWTQWREHRRQIKKPMTALAETMALKDLATKGTERAIAAINHSIANGWQGIFEPQQQGRREPDLMGSLLRFAESGGDE